MGQSTHRNGYAKLKCDATAHAVIMLSPAPAMIRHAGVGDEECGVREASHSAAAFFSKTAEMCASVSKPENFPMTTTSPSPSHQIGMAQRWSLLALLVSSMACASAATVPSNFSDSVYASGLSNPTAMAWSPDGRLFVCTQGGSLRVIKNGTLLATPFVRVTVDGNGERGLLGVAFDPNFSSNRLVYVQYTATSPATRSRISRFTADSGNPDVSSGGEQVLFDYDNLSSATNHNGGALHFGPDGKLYSAHGENANGAHAQTLNNLLGKILRLNSDGTIPSDNPFFNQATGNNRAIYALGLRNPFTFAFQPGTGRLYINDVGQGSWEEINDGAAGRNYGWPNVEGNGSFSPAIGTYSNPVRSYPTSHGCAITGGTFVSVRRSFCRLSPGAAQKTMTTIAGHGRDHSRCRAKATGRLTS